MKLHNKTKLLFTFILCMVPILSLLCFSASASESDDYDFANFTEEDSITFVEQYGVDIPETLLQSEDFPTVTQELILAIHNYPAISFSYDTIEMQQYAEDIRALVRVFMGLGLIFPDNMTDYCLQHSKVLNEDGEWVTSDGDYNSKWDNYNCYAYAINRCEYPAFYSTEDQYSPRLQYSPGKMSGQEDWRSGGITVQEVAGVVMDDLRAMGYSDVIDWPAIPQIGPSQELICLRLCGGDYHFMRYDPATDAWYHKPSYNAVLRYNYIPCNELPWYVESSKNGHESAYTEMDDVYDSDIIFITYTKKQINVGYSEVIEVASINPQKDVFYELNFEYLGTHLLLLGSTDAYHYDLYNENFDIVLSGDGTSVSRYFVNTEDKYYLRINSALGSSHTEDHVVYISIEYYAE